MAKKEKLDHLTLAALTAQDAGKTLREEGNLVGKVRLRKGAVVVAFEYRYKSGGKGRSVACGIWPDASLKAIRQKRDELRVQVSGGVDPVAEKEKAAELRQLEQSKTEAEARLALAQAEEHERAEKARLAAEAAKRRSVREGFEQWYQLELIRRKEPGRSEAKRALEKDILPALADVALPDVTKAMLVDLLDKVVARGARIMANRLFADVKQAFEYFADREWMEKNPLAGMKKEKIGGKEKEKERVLSEAEIQELRDKLPGARMQHTTERAIWIMLATCCRVGELTKARWEHVDFQAATWTIPPDNAKNAERHTIYLSPFALRQFEALRQLTGTSEWCYPAEQGAGHLCLKSITKQIKDRQTDSPLSKRTKAVGALILIGGTWTPHDLRRTGATLMGELGVLREVVERVLNHKRPKLERTYQKQKMQTEQRAAWELLGERLELLLRDAHDNVVVLRRVA